MSIEGMLESRRVRLAIPNGRITGTIRFSVVITGLVPVIPLRWAI